MKPRTNAYPSLLLYNLFAKNRSVPPGSHKYQGEWSQLDQIILSSSLTDTTSQMQLIPGSARIFSPSFLLIKDKTWRGERPFPHLLWLQIQRWLQRPSPFDRRLSTIEINDYFCFLNTDRICTNYISPYCFFFIQTISAQQLRQPFDFPILLSGNFGELRNNHFHSGIDFKTQGVEGKPIHAVQDGYVSRISVSPWGYGNGLYLTHPDGTTTVYGHLQRFAPSIARYIKTQQYEQESFNVNLFLDPDQLPVKKGEIVAYSGNTGSSGRPASPLRSTRHGK